MVLLYGEEYYCSTSTVGWILHKLKERGVLREAVLSNHVSARKRQRQCPYAVRKPREYATKEPGIELNRALLKWKKVYNTIQPHQALGYLTRQQFLERCWQNQTIWLCLSLR